MDDNTLRQRHSEVSNERRRSRPEARPGRRGQGAQPRRRRRIAHARGRRVLARDLDPAANPAVDEVMPDEITAPDDKSQAPDGQADDTETGEETDPEAGQEAEDGSVGAAGLGDGGVPLPPSGRELPPLVVHRLDSRGGGSSIAAAGWVHEQCDRRDKPRRRGRQDLVAAARGHLSSAGHRGRARGARRTPPGPPTSVGAAAPRRLPQPHGRADLAATRLGGHAPCRGLGPVPRLGATGHRGAGQVAPRRVGHPRRHRQGPAHPRRRFVPEHGAKESAATLSLRASSRRPCDCWCAVARLARRHRGGASPLCCGSNRAGATSERIRAAGGPRTRIHPRSSTTRTSRRTTTGTSVDGDRDAPSSDPGSPGPSAACMAEHPRRHAPGPDLNLRARRHRGRLPTAAASTSPHPRGRRTDRRTSATAQAHASATSGAGADADGMAQTVPLAWRQVRPGLDGPRPESPRCSDPRSERGRRNTRALRRAREDSGGSQSPGGRQIPLSASAQPQAVTGGKGAGAPMLGMPSPTPEGVAGSEVRRSQASPARVRRTDENRSVCDEVVRRGLGDLDDHHVAGPDGPSAPGEGLKCTSRLSGPRPESRCVAASLRPSPSETISSTGVPTSALPSSHAISLTTSTSRW